MPNLKCKIVLRLPTAAGRGWINAPTGKDDPKGVYYLRLYEGEKMKHVRVGPDFHDAEIAQHQRERLLLAHSQGFVLAEEENVDTKKFHSCVETIDAYLKMLRGKTRRNGRCYSSRSLKARRSELLAFIASSGRKFIEQITPQDILDFKERLHAAGKANDTVLNKMMIVVSWLKRNPVVPRTGMIQASDWPEKLRSKARPYTTAEIEAMMDAAKSYQESLLMRLLFASGLRLGEAKHLEFEDLDTLAGCVHVRSKPGLGWETKTKRSERDIPLDVELIEELLTLGKSGLVFHGKNGKPVRLERTLERIGKAAGVKPPVGDKKASWTHRWRDSFATALVRERVHTDRDISDFLGHESLEVLKLYVEAARMDSPDTRKSAANANRFKTPRLQVVNG